MKDLIQRPENSLFDATLRVANPNAAGYERFQFAPKETGSSPYFVVDLVQHGISAFSGVQIKSHTATIFVADNNLMAQAIIKDCNLPADAQNRVVDMTTGKVSEPMHGAMVYIPIGEHKLTFTPKATTANPSPVPVTTEVTTVPQFVFAGEDFAAVMLRVHKRVAKDPTYVAVEPKVTVQDQVENDLGKQ